MGIPRDKKILLFASRVCKEKSVDVVMDAFPAILEQYPECVLVITGEGPYESELKRKIKKNNLEDKVFLYGYLSRGDLYAFYKTADLFIFPSVSETQGIVVLEAQYFQTPVVGTAQNGVAMIMEGEKGGILAKEPIPEDIASLTLSLLKDPALYQQKAQEAYENTKGWDTAIFAKKMEQEMSALVTPAVPK